MALPHMLAKVVQFLRSGYPDISPGHHYLPLLALLRRRLTDDEVVAVATELTIAGTQPLHGTDIGVAITKITDALPSADDTERVTQLLTAVGRTVEDPFKSSD